MGKLTDVGCLLLAAGLSAAHAEITLTDLQNRKATVEIVAASPTDITVETQGRRSTIKLDLLSAESRTAAVDYAKSKGVYNSFPAVQVQVKIAYQRKNSDSSWYRKDVKLIPTFTIEGVRKMDTIPDVEATLVLITHDTREKYVRNVDKMKVYSTETIPVPAGKGERREIEFKAIMTTFDSARNSTNVGGDEYCYYIFALRDPATKQIVDFQTNCTKLQAHAARHPEAREAALAAEKGAAFSGDFPDK